MTIVDFLVHAVIDRATLDLLVLCNFFEFSKNG